jgi:hypothetical protein
LQKVPEPRLEGMKKVVGNNPDIRPEALVPERDPRLTGYRWVDEKEGIVQIPITVAMDLIVKKNLLRAEPRKRGGRDPEKGHQPPGESSSGRTPAKEGR